jgi:hypothetical protein
MPDRVEIWNRRSPTEARGEVKALEWKQLSDATTRDTFGDRFIAWGGGVMYVISSTAWAEGHKPWRFNDETFETADKAKAAADELYTKRILAALSHPPAREAVDETEQDYFGGLVGRARAAAAKASIKFPQPNYVTLKIAEEAGEVVRGAVHYAENRMEWAEVEGEIVQLLAMLIRFVTEGDEVNGVKPPALLAAVQVKP